MMTEFKILSLEKNENEILSVIKSKKNLKVYRNNDLEETFLVSDIGIDNLTMLIRDELIETLKYYIDDE